MRFDLPADGFAPSAVSTLGSGTSRGVVSTAAHTTSSRMMRRRRASPRTCSKGGQSVCELVLLTDATTCKMPTKLLTWTGSPPCEINRNYCHGLTIDQSVTIIFYSFLIFCVSERSRAAAVRRLNFVPSGWRCRWTRRESFR